MKKILLFVCAVSLALPLLGQGRGKIVLPNLNGYVTLKCDFHMHTVFSDGTVWPTVRIDEASREGLDAIAITDHIEYLPHKADIAGSFNRSYEIAAEAAKTRGIILIKGSEITRSMPPGHINAIFITNSDPLNTPDVMDALRVAKAQNGFLFWNHPGWDSQQPDTTLWWPEHTKIYDQGLMQGIEIVNGDYYPEAHRWALEKKLTMFGNSDVHTPQPNYAPGKHRTMTLVFAREATPESIHEALIDRRTAVYHEEYVIGEERFLKELFKNALDINIERNEENHTARIILKNKSDLVFHLSKGQHDPRLTYFRNNLLGPYTVYPQGTLTINVRLNNGVKGGDVNLIVENFLVQPEKGMKYTIQL